MNKGIIIIHIHNLVDKVCRLRNNVTLSERFKSKSTPAPPKRGKNKIILMEQKMKSKLIIKTLSLMFVFMLSSLNAQEVNYTEVNVFGWGKGMDRGAPALKDIDNDGYMDLLVGNNDGVIWHLEQSTGDDFTLISRNFSDINVGGEAYPTFTDIDNDGLIDLVVGDNSDITWYEQQDTNSNAFVFVSDQMISVNIGAHYCPAFADLNKDGLLELIIGESLGNFNYFEQDSINAGTFTLVTENWMGWDGGTYVSPFFTDMENDGLLDLLVGDAYGKIFHLVQDDSVSTTFTQVSDNFGGIDVGESAVPIILDLDGDNKMDLFVGEWYNGLFHYEQNDSLSENYTLISDDVFGTRDFGYAIGYTIGDIDGDGLLDMLVSAYHDYYESYVVLLEQEEAGSLNFIMQDEQFNDINIRNFTNLALYDINGNGLLDLLIGDSQGYVKRYEQDALNSYEFSLVDEEFNNNMKVFQCPHLTFADIDGDSLLDMLSGEGNGVIHYYEQDSVNAVTFTELNSKFLGLDVGWYSAPQFTDIDGDSLLDLIIGDTFGRLRYYEQDSVNSEGFSLINLDFALNTVEHRAIPRFYDINNDGKTDMFVGGNAGGITLHLRNDDLDITAPDVPQNLSASVDSNFVKLSWSACEAEDLLLYNIYRSTRNDTSVAEYLYSVDFDVPTFTDSSLTTSGTYFYWVSALDLLGNESDFSSSDSATIEILVGINDKPQALETFKLYQNYPNPFNPTTTIEYFVQTIHESSQRVNLSIYNLLGQKVATLVDKKQSAGTYTVQWDASELSTGIYIYRLTAGNYTQIRKAVLIK